MRWNCPHCEELVTAGIDFENTKKAYVRCAKCNGMALVHRSAVFADYVKARRLEEEAQLEAELRITQTATANSRVQSMEGHIRGLNEKLSAAAVHAASSATVAANANSDAIEAARPLAMPPPPNAAMSPSTNPPRGSAMNAGMDLTMEMITAPHLPTPPPFLSSFGPTEAHADEITITHDVYSAPPIFLYSKPPAFLLKTTANAIETLERAFAIDGDESPMDAIVATPIVTTLEVESIRARMTARLATIVPPSLRPTIALWTAAALAIASGAYLYVEGKKALAPVTTPITMAPPNTAVIQADEIRSKANSAIRPETRSLAIVRVARAVLRNGPSVESSSLQTLERSAVANVVEMKDGWIRIESPRIETPNRSAWVRSDLVVQMPR